MAEKVAVILTSQKDWDEWIEVTKSIVIASGTWNLVNPEMTNPPIIKEPPAPKPTDVNPNEYPNKYPNECLNKCPNECQNKRPDSMKGR